MNLRSSAPAAGLVAVLAVLAGCRPAPDPPPPVPAADDSPDGPPWFEDVTARLGVDFTHDPGPTDKYPMPQIMGSGCAVCDLDGDGRPDLLFLTNGGPTAKSTNGLYRQKPDGTFEDVTAGSGLDFPGFNMGVAVGDVDNDGRPDLLITQYTGARLFLNRGGMKFQDVTAEAGIKNPLWGASAAFLDFDRDGWLDLFIVNYIDYDPNWPCRSRTGEADYCGPKTFHGTASKLFRNRGGRLAQDTAADKPRAAFEDVSVGSRVGSVPGPGLGIAVADFDGDGWPDVFVANDGQPNRLWINRRDGTFAEEAVPRGAAYTQMGQEYAGMGVAAGDADNDGLVDLFVTHLGSETNTLWRQGPRGVFKDATAAAGLTATKWRGTGFGTLMADFDHDGWVDIAVVNGRIDRARAASPGPGLSPHWAPYGERNQLLANTGGGRFKDVSANTPGFCGYVTVARGLACGDVDGDGAPDLVVNAVGEKARVFRNVARDRGHWVKVRAVVPVGPTATRDAYGAEVAVRAGGTRRVRVVSSAGSFLSASPPVAHVGLGPATAVEGFDVTWPDGARETFPGGTVDREFELRKGSGKKP
ncbi:MAG: hypothetical protein JWO38_902 [Gemmataceae bacterium]|nr:hypothetical protein [Gemmataceae bacterium]